MINKQDSGTPSLLNRLVSLTTIRDIELFEISLLKTLTELLRIRQISRYKLNPSKNTCWISTYSTSVVQDDNKRQFSESQEIYTSETTVPEEVMAAQLWINTTRKPYTYNKNHQYLIIYPIIGAHKIESLLSFELSHPLTENEMLIISSLLGITHNFRSLLDENQKDKLTGLLNRQTFEESIYKIQSLLVTAVVDSDNKWEKENKRKTKKGSEKLYLAIIDVDNFKSINDRFGHIMGDEVLLLLSYIMKQIFRAKDLLFRFGGEEFVAIIRTQDKQEAHKVLERLRNKIEQYRFPQINTVTISIGATLIKNGHFLPAEIISRADQALYHAKNHGKNQFHFYEDLVDSQHIEEIRETGTIDFF